MKFGIQKEMSGGWIARGFGIEEQDSGTQLLGLTSKSYNMLIFTPIDPNDRRIVICDPTASDTDDYYFRFRKGGAATWDTRYEMQMIIDFIVEVDKSMSAFVDPITGLRTQRRIKQP